MIVFYQRLPELGTIEFAKHIEGVGSTYGLLRPMVVHSYNEYTLDCYNQKNLDTLTLTQYCYFNVDIQEKLNNGFIKIYPNPTTEFINISAENIPQNMTPATFSLYNSEGKLCQMQTIERGVSFYQKNVQQLPQGIYCWQLKNNNVAFYSSGKIIITH